MIKRVSTANMSRGEWLQRRKNTIGGSDAAGIVGLSKWSSAYAVWAEKTNRLPEKEDTEAMRQGRDLEAYVAQRWSEETGKRVHRVNAMLYNSQYPFAHADVDRLVTGENAGLECKTTFTLDLREFHGVEFPVKYYAQCVHYLAVTGAARWYLAVLVYGRGFFVYKLERDQQEIDALMAAEQNFWELVKNDTPPEADGSEASTEALQTVFPHSTSRKVGLFGRETILREYLELKNQKKQLNDRMGEIENALKRDLGDAEAGECGCFRVSWKSQMRRSFQTQVFQADNPSIDLEPYYKTTNLRPFKVTEQIKEAV